MIKALRNVIKRMHCPLGMVLTCARVSAERHIKETMTESGVCVDHATVQLLGAVQAAHTLLLRRQDQELQ